MGTRKPDKRTQATKTTIKQGLLESLNNKPYRAINVTEICQQCFISRGTFYQHYHSLDDVLDELIEEACQQMSDGPICSDPTEQNCKVSISLGSGRPLCSYILDDNPFQALFNDLDVTDRLINKITQAFDEKTKDPKSTERHLLNIFRISGCISAARYAKRQGINWKEVQPHLDSFIAAGIKN